VYPIRRKIFFEPAVAYIEECVWRPAADVRRAPYGWLVKVELPGVAPDQIRLVLRGNSLILSGVRKDTHLMEGESYYAMEISYCPFERRIELPVRIEGAEVVLAHDNGLLLLKLVQVGEEPR
jgi:HSP20 family protein